MTFCGVGEGTAVHMYIFMGITCSVFEGCEGEIKWCKAVCCKDVVLVSYTFGR